MLDMTSEQTTLWLYDRYAPTVLRYLINLTGNREEAEDLAQETFLKVLSYGGRPASEGSAEGWLLRIARNAAYDSFRRRRRRFDTMYWSGELDLVPSPDNVSRVGEHDEVANALRHLPAAYRVLLLLHGVAGYSLEELAATQGLKLGTVKSRLYRARARFRALYAGT